MINLTKRQENRMNPPLKAMWVLLVEDTHDQSLDLKQMLQTFGAEVMHATAVAEALIMLEQFTPDLLVSNLNASDKTSYVLLEQMRSSEMARRDRPVPALVILNAIEPEQQQRIFPSEFQVYLERPCQMPDFLRAIRLLIEQAQTA